ncbi:MAG: hypothetical protein ACK55I_36595, partial [bacterium]
PGQGARLDGPGLVGQPGPHGQWRDIRVRQHLQAGPGKALPEGRQHGQRDDEVADGPAPDHEDPSLPGGGGAGRVIDGHRTTALPDRPRRGKRQGALHGPPAAASHPFRDRQRAPGPGRLLG